MIYSRILILIFFMIFAIIKCSGCGEGCVDCTWDGSLWDCDECAEGYFIDETLWYGLCKKKCIENYEDETSCKVCDVGDNRDKCIECHENYSLSKDKKSCIPKFILCGEEKHFNCKKCDINSLNSSSCGECNYHYILIDGFCEYDLNTTKYSYGNFFNKSFSMFISLIIILFL